MLLKKQNTKIEDLILYLFWNMLWYSRKFGFDVYKYKKKRVTNKDEQN